MTAFAQPQLVRRLSTWEVESVYRTVIAVHVLIALTCLVLTVGVVFAKEIEGPHGALSVPGSVSIHALANFGIWVFGGLVAHGLIVWRRIGIHDERFKVATEAIRRVENKVDVNQQQMNEISIELAKLRGAVSRSSPVGEE